MAAIDAVAADKRATDIIAKYRQRWHDEHKGSMPATAPAAPAAPPVAGTPEWFAEMQSDVANAINAAVHEVLNEPVPAIQRTPAQEVAKTQTRPPVEHMPATGHSTPKTPATSTLSAKPAPAPVPKPLGTAKK